MNNASLGITLQKVICDMYGIDLHPNAVEQFHKNYNQQYKEILIPAIKSIFKEIGSDPTICLTYSPSNTSGEKLSPHNFILENKKTLSIRTNKSNSKIAPRVIGQAGLDTFNYHFNQFFDYIIKEKEEIKAVIYNNIHKMLPIFLDYLFLSDYTVWVKYNNGDVSYSIFDRNLYVDLDFNRSNFSFTRDLTNWIESTTLKYNDLSIAEIQIHTSRTFKFRFIMDNITKFLKEFSTTNETLGMTAEKTVCDLFNLTYPEHLRNRSSYVLQQQIKPIVEKSFSNLPNAVKHTGSNQGSRGKESKCPYDFILEGNKTLSLKTNIGSMVCPPEVGQPSSSTCYKYFGHLIKETEINEINFKKMVLSSIDKMMPIYVNYLFDSDFLLWIYKDKDGFNSKIFNKKYANSLVWDKNKFSFTRDTLDKWNESTTVKYNNVSVGEFQVHKSRNCYKFRFNMPNFINIIEGDI